MSLRTRFLIALALTIAFYALAIGLAVALIGLPLWAWASVGHFNVWLSFFCVVAGFTILRAIAPRRQKFVAPGVQVDSGDQPRLMEVVDEIASETQQQPPEETYVTLEPNAAVTQVGGGLRGHGRRVLIVGLPFARILTAGELRAVLAHEFGHYAGGDTRIGQWVYRTRAAIERTIVGLHDEDSWGMRAVQRPFIWYGNAFLRITNAISRRQEFAADAWAVQVGGAAAHASALRKVHRLAPAFDAFWGQEVVPALEVGAQPPVGAGYEQFLSVPAISEACDKQLAADLEQAKSDPYSSHPTLPERLAAIGDVSAAPREDGPPALELFDRPEELERRVLERLAEAAGAPALEPIAWEDVGARVYRRRYSELVSEHGRLLEGLTLSGLPSAAAYPGALAQRAFGGDAGEDAAPLVFATLGAGLALALVEQGWEIEAPLGQAVSCRRGDAVVEPFTVIEDMASRELDPEAWAERLAELGVEDAPLAATAPAPAAG